MCGTCGCVSEAPSPSPPDQRVRLRSNGELAPSGGASRNQPLVEGRVTQAESHAPDAGDHDPQAGDHDPPESAAAPRGGAELSAAKLSAADLSAAASRTYLLQQRLLAHNDQHAAANRARLQAAGVLALNLLSSPGSGKTALLEALGRLQSPSPGPNASGSLQAPSGPQQAVIVGDLATEHDALRLRAAGLPAVQISTGQGCHLEASQVASALDRLEAGGQRLDQLDWLWIENVGNLVCPAAYDLGEALRLVLLSVTEGEDKPLKYPSLFQTADLVLISKLDLAEAVAFRRQEAHQAIRRVAPRARILEVSARSGAGLEALRDLLQQLLPPLAQPPVQPLVPLLMPPLVQPLVPPLVQPPPPVPPPPLVPLLVQHKVGLPLHQATPAGSDDPTTSTRQAAPGVAGAPVPEEGSTAPRDGHPGPRSPGR